MVSLILIGPIFKVNVLGKQIVFVCNVALLDEVCDERRFRKCVTGAIVEMRHVANDCLFTAYDYEKSWGIAHRIMAPYVSRSGVDSCFNDMATVIPDLTHKWTSGVNKRVLITSDLDRLLMASVMQCFYNQRVHILEGPEPAIIQAWNDIPMEAKRRSSRPRLLNWLYQSGFQRDIKTMRDLAADIVKTRKEHPEQSRNDLLDALCNNSDPVTGEKLSGTQVIDEVVTMFIGAATAANLVSYALYYLVKRPDEITKATVEIDSIVGPDKKIQLEDLKKLKYCEAIIRETLRLCATAPGFNLEPIPPKDQGNEDPVFLAGGKYQIPNNQLIMAILHTVNRDPEIFEDPDIFRPERVLGEKWDNLPKAAKRGFGNGKRECYGTMWAWRWSIFTLASILKEVTFELEDPQYNLHANGAFSLKPLDFYGLVGPRKG